MDAKIMDAKIMDVKIIDAKITDGIFIGREIKKARFYSRFNKMALAVRKDESCKSFVTLVALFGTIMNKKKDIFFKITSYSLVGLG